MIFRKSDAIFLTINALLLAGLLLISHQAQAETHLHTGAWSHHVGSEYDYNETHNLLAVEHNGYLAGYFKNSQNDDSALVAARWRKAYPYSLEASVLVGATYGYREDCVKPDTVGRKRVCPLAVPAITYTGSQPQPSVMIMGNAVTFSVRWKL